MANQNPDNLQTIDIPIKSSAFKSKLVDGWSTSANDGKGGWGKVDLLQEALHLEWYRFHGPYSKPRYDENKRKHFIAVKTDILCTKDYTADVESKALRTGMQALFEHYDKRWDEEDIDAFLAHPEAAPVIEDKHMASRPFDRFKVLISVDARYLNAHPDAPPHESFLDCLDTSGRYPTLRTEDSLLYPGPMDSTDPLQGISVMTLKSDKYENELKKTSHYIMAQHNDMMMSGLKVKGVSLENESERMWDLSSMLYALVSDNYKDTGYGTGRNTGWVSGDIAEPSYLYSVFHESMNTLAGTQNNPYEIKIAFQINPETEAINILWAACNYGSGDQYMGVGLKTLLNTHPLSNPSTLHYFYWHQQILNNLDRDIVVDWSSFIKAYHYPKVNSTNVFENANEKAPFADNSANLNVMAEGAYGDVEAATGPNKKSKKCGLQWPQPFAWQPNIADMLKYLFEPMAYDLASLNISLFSFGPPCPAPYTGMGTPLWMTFDHYKFEGEVGNSDENLKKMFEETEKEFDYIGDYFSSEQFGKDITAKFQSSIFRLRKLGDIIMNRFTIEKMLKMVCICLAQMAQQMAHPDGGPEFPSSAGVALKAPGFKFNPAMISSDDPNFNLKEAIELSTFAIEQNIPMEEFNFQKLCSFCFNFPAIDYKLPTWDLIEALLAALAALIEAIIVQLLILLIQQLLNWILQCPSYECDIRPKGPAINDYGAADLNDMFKAPPDCLSEFIPDDADLDPFINVQELETVLLGKISSNLSSGEMANLLEGSPTENVLNIIRDMIQEDEDFGKLRDHMNMAALQDYLTCIANAMPDIALSELEREIADPEYCAPPDSLPAANMREKCEDMEEVEKFLMKEQSGQAAMLQGLINEFRNNPNTLQDMMPQIFSSRDPDTNELKPGVLSDFAPPVADTMLDLTVDPMLNHVNSVAQLEGRGYLQMLYQKNPEGQANLKFLSGLGPFAMLLAKNAKFGIDTTYPIVAGHLRTGLLSFENPTIFGYVKYSEPKTLDYSNSAIQALSLAGVSSPELREFNTRLKANTSKHGRLHMHIESDTPLSQATNAKDGLENNIVIRLHTSCNPIGANGPFTYDKELKKCVASAPTPSGVYKKVSHPSSFVVDTYNTEYKAFSFKASLGKDQQTEESVYSLIEGLAEDGLPFKKTYDNGTAENSPQAKVMSLLANGYYGNISGNELSFADGVYVGFGVFTQIDPWSFGAFLENPESKILYEQLFQEHIHPYAISDLISKVTKRVAASPHFRTYSFEQMWPENIWDEDEGWTIHDDASLSVDGFTPDSVKTSTLMNKSLVKIMKKDGLPFPAQDVGPKGTKFYFPPIPAMENTALAKGKYELIAKENTKQEIKDKWEWAEQWDPKDLEELPPLNKAMLDVFLPEIAAVYSADVAIKASFLINALNLTDENANNQLLSEVISQIFLNDIKKESDEFVNKFPEQTENYWIRKYKEDEELDVINAPKGDAAILQLMSENIPRGIEKAKMLTKLQHAYDPDNNCELKSNFVESINPEELVILKGSTLATSIATGDATLMSIPTAQKIDLLTTSGQNVAEIYSDVEGDAQDFAAAVNLSLSLGGSGDFLGYKPIFKKTYFPVRELKNVGFQHPPTIAGNYTGTSPAIDKRKFTSPEFSTYNTTSTGPNTANFTIDNINNELYNGSFVYESYVRFDLKPEFKTIYNKWLEKGYKITVGPESPAYTSVSTMIYGSVMSYLSENSHDVYTKIFDQDMALNTAFSNNPGKDNQYSSFMQSLAYMFLIADAGLQGNDLIMGGQYVDFLSDLTPDDIAYIQNIASSEDIFSYFHAGLRLSYVMVEDKFSSDGEANKDIFDKAQEILEKENEIVNPGATNYFTRRCHTSNSFLITEESIETLADLEENTLLNTDGQVPEFNLDSSAKTKTRTLVLPFISKESPVIFDYSLNNISTIGLYRFTFDQIFQEDHYNSLLSQIEQSDMYKALFSYSLQRDLSIDFVFLYCLMSIYEIPGARRGLNMTKQLLKKYFLTMGIRTGLDALPTEKIDTPLPDTQDPENPELSENAESSEDDEEQIMC